MDPVHLTIKTHLEPFSQHNYHSIWGSPCLTAEELHPAILPPPISPCTECQHYLFWHLQEKTGNCEWRTDYIKEKKSSSLALASLKELRWEKEIQQMLLNHRPTLWEQMPTGGHATDHAWQSDSQDMRSWITVELQIFNLEVSAHAWKSLGIVWMLGKLHTFKASLQKEE